MNSQACTTKTHTMQTDDNVIGATRPAPVDPSARVLARVADRLTAATLCAVRIGAEIEFYLDRSLPKAHAAVLDASARAFAAAGIQTAPIRSEAGEAQYEVSLLPSLDPVTLATSLEKVRSIVTAVSLLHGCPAAFSSRPDPSNPPSSLQINVSLIDVAGANCFAKEPNTASETEIMQHAIAGLCDFMNGSMLFFAPTELSYKRFVNRFSGGPYKFTNAPSTVSWGGNNRTVAVRIPSSSEDPVSRHIEHRVPGSDANPALAIACVLAGISHGIEHRLPLTLEKVWGDASNEGCGVPLVRSLREAVAAYFACNELRARMDLSG